MQPRKRWVSGHSAQFHARRIARDVLIDVAILYAAYGVAFMLRALTTPLDYDQSLCFISYAIFVHVSTLYLFGAYHRLWSKTSGHSITVLINAVGMAVTIALLSDLVLNPHPVPLSVILLGGLFALLGFTTVRYRSRLISGLSWRWQAVWHYRFPPSQTCVLIVGAGSAGQVVAWRLKYRSPQHHYQIVGFIDDDPRKQGMYVEGSKVLGTRHDILRIAEAHQVDLIIVAIHSIAGADMRDILSRCEATHAMVKVVPDLFDLMRSTTNAPPLRDVEAEDLIGRTIITRCESVDLTPVEAKRVLVTGAAGSIGSELSRQLVHFKPDTLILLDNNESGLHDLNTELSALFPQLSLVPVLADITVPEQIGAVFEAHQPQVVFHAAAYKHVPMLQRYPNEGIRTNIYGTWRLAEFARDYGVERFVLISTDKAVNPENVMGATKRVCELILHMLTLQNNHKTLFTAVRFGNVVGSRGSVVPTFARQIDSGGPVTITHQEMTRYFMSIPEAANLVIHAACLTRGDDIFILKMGEVVRIVELAERMIRLRGLRPYVDIRIEFTGIRPGEKLHEELYSASECPSETIHPQIIQLHNWDDRFNPEIFLRNLTFVLGRRFENCTDALEQLRDLASQAGRVVPDENLPVRTFMGSTEALRLTEQHLFKSVFKHSTALRYSSSARGIEDGPNGPFLILATSSTLWLGSVLEMAGSPYPTRRSQNRSGNQSRVEADYPFGPGAARRQGKDHR